jgi:hypothetical protein
MAKLSAHGTEILRLRKPLQTGAAHDSEDGLTQVRTIAFMSDGHTLVKVDSTYVGEFSGKVERVSSGWKLGKRTFHNALASFDIPTVIAKLKADFWEYDVVA